MRCVARPSVKMAGRRRGGRGMEMSLMGGSSTNEIDAAADELEDLLRQVESGLEDCQMITGAPHTVSSRSRWLGLVWGSKGSGGGRGGAAARVGCAEDRAPVLLHQAPSGSHSPTPLACGAETARPRTPAWCCIAWWCLTPRCVVRRIIAGRPRRARGEGEAADGEDVPRS